MTDENNIKRQRTTRLIAAIAAAGTMLFAFWCGGFDFDKRGDTAIMCLVLTLCSAVGGYAFTAMIQSEDY